MIYVFGDSHRARFQHINNRLEAEGKAPRFSVHGDSGLTAYGIGKQDDISVLGRPSGPGIALLAKMLEEVTKEDLIIFCLGEVDCRIQIYYRHRTANKSIEELIDIVVLQYGNVLQMLNKRFEIAVMDVIPAVRQTNTYGLEFYATREERAEITIQFNKRLEKFCADYGIPFIKMHHQLADERGYLKDSYAESDGAHAQVPTIDLIDFERLMPDPLPVSVVGYGTVGEAVAEGLKRNGRQVNIYDPEKGHEDPVEGVVFICIYTDDMVILESVVEKYAKNPLVIIKTTLVPGTTEKLITKFGNHIVYAPEFLDGCTALEDFLNPDKVVIGMSGATSTRLVRMFCGAGGDVLYMKPTEAEILKLSINSFYAVKVEYFNEVADLCERYGANYNAVRVGLELDRYIANQHLDVEKDGYRGFGGKCLPKDLGMFIRACNAEMLEAKVVDAARAANDLRKDKQ